ncbi:hypothetical protein O181_005333 [Austropuccinia psidii MF-1]|uniref:Uncharacterized protein n=1 Tax=Austropuccinia psidii MF-1 TaxID=1389203 RepID=A0A9Q3BI23_9BASI|nr:hypothetical protein [Austropuccinia psidii MF-1]
MFEKGWSLRLPHDSLERKLIDIPPTARIFRLILDKEIHHAKRCTEDSFKYAKERWDNTHNPPDYKIGDLVLVSTLNFDKTKRPEKLKDSFAGTFMIRALHGLNAVQLELTGELIKKHPVFPEGLIKSYSSTDKKVFSLIIKPPLELPLYKKDKKRKL